MPLETANLDVCCPTLGSEVFGTKVNQVITLLNDLKLRENGHTHAAVDSAPDSAAVTAPVVGSLSSVSSLNVLCPLGTLQGGFGTLMNLIVVLLNELRVDYLAHGHSAFGVVATEQIVAVAPVALTAPEIDIANGVCVSLGNPQLGTRLVAIITLLTEVRTAHNTHVHPAVITAATDQVIASSDVVVLD